MNPLCLKTLCGLGVATSIDALAVGVSLAMLQTSLYVVLLTIAAVTFLFPCLVSVLAVMSEVSSISNWIWSAGLY